MENILKEMAVMKIPLTLIPSKQSAVLVEMKNENGSDDPFS